MNQQDIYISEKGGTREIRIPWLPEYVRYSPNGVNFVSYDILDLGEVKRQAGKNIGVYRWDSIFPGEGRKGMPFLRGTWQNPKKYQEIINTWIEKGPVLRLLITNTPINHDVFLSDCPIDYTGAFGDYEYSIEFCDYRNLTISSSVVKDPIPEQKRASEQTKTYTVVAGDTLWGIAARPTIYGNGLKWTVIYEANKAIIEETAKKRGFSSSNNGHWIFAGTIFKIP